MNEPALHYCCVDCDNGEFAKLRVFRDLESLARFISESEGEDKVIWCFYGTPLRLTKGPRRYLLLPDNRAVTIPVFHSDSVEILERAPENVEIQEDGFVGPSYLAPQ